MFLIISTYRITKIKINYLKQYKYIVKNIQTVKYTLSPLRIVSYRI